MFLLLIWSVNLYLMARIGYFSTFMDMFFWALYTVFVIMPFAL